jgi:hypothetical protein
MHQNEHTNCGVTSTCMRVGRIVCWLVLLTRVTAAEESSTPHNTRTTFHTETPAPFPSCIYTQWSAWSGYCPPANACGGGIQTRTRAPAGDIDRCRDTMQERMCDEDCTHVVATVGLIVNGLIDNPASTEDPISPVVVEDIRYTYGSLSSCSRGCGDIHGLNRNHDIVCVTCMNPHSCGRAGALRMNNPGKLDLVRNKREGPYAMKVDGLPCSCSFTPQFPLMSGMCSSPSYYINFTVL